MDLFEGELGTVRVTNGGSGYTSAPTVTITPPYPEGRYDYARATLEARISNAEVTEVVVTDGGELYRGNQYYDYNTGTYIDHVITFDNTGTGGSGAAAEPDTWNFFTGDVEEVTVTNGGSGYTSTPTVTFESSGQGTATGIATISQSVDSIIVSSGGTGYTSAPTVTLSGGGGSGAKAVAHLHGSVGEIEIVNAGTSYTSAPTVTISGGEGSRATATATISTDGLPEVELTDEVTSSTYTAEPTVTASGSGTGGVVKSGDNEVCSRCHV